MSELGSYITYEYGILFKILSYLPGKTLDIVCNVCREWRDVAKRILMKRNKPLGYFRKGGEVWPGFDDKVKPKVVLHFQCTWGVKNMGHDFYPMITGIYGLDNISSYNIRNYYFIFSQYYDGRLTVNHRLGKNSESALLLCDMPGAFVHGCFYSQMSAENEKQKLEIAEGIMSLKDPKCIILIAGGCAGCTELADLIIDKYEEEKRETIFLVGGIAIKPPKLSVHHADPYPVESCVCLSFYGPNVTATGGLHELSQNMDEFFQDLSRRAGPLSSGSQRFAFMFSCINRFDIYGDREVKCFQRHFPDVPVYGMWSYGEVFAQLNEDFCRTSPPCLVTECTSYVIMTFKKDV